MADRVLVVGCGSIGQRHLRNLVALGTVEVHATDLSSGRREEAQRIGATVHPDLDAALSASPTAVLICTPPVAHVDPARSAVEAGAHLLIEKPIAAELEGVDDLLEAALRRDRVVLVGYNLRYHAGLRRAKQLLDDGAIGRPLLVRAEFGWYLPDWRPQRDYRTTYSAQRALGGGIVLDASHEIDYVRWLAGEVATVSATLARVGSLELDVEDTAALAMTHSSGMVSEIHVDLLQRAYSRGCKVVGTEGTIVWEMREGIRVQRGGSAQWASTPIAPDWNDMYRDEVAHFLACVEGRERPRVTGADGRRVLEIALAAKRSARDGSLVRL
jgi:predicted dehydrogenase